LPGTTRLVWAAVLSESQGLALLFVRKPDEKWNHEIVLATENVKDRCFELANVSRFPVEPEDLQQIAHGLAAMGEGIADDEFDNFLNNKGLM
jgi:hypothetical protein